MGNTSPDFSDLLIVIVLYRTQLCDSVTYQSLEQCFSAYNTENQKVDLIVVNNGPLYADYPVNSTLFNLHLVQQLDNPGVSKAYNLAGQLAVSLRKSWMLILDQDTALPPNFWQFYRRSADTQPTVPVHAPRLYDGSTLASPCGYRFYRGHVLSEIPTGLTEMHGKNVLNSGLLLNTDAFQRVGGYDENVPLYFSDFVFFDRLKTLYRTFVVIDIELAHNLSSSDFSNEKIASERFILYCDGARAAAKKQLSRQILYFLTVGARSLLMNQRFKTFRFSNYFLKSWLSPSLIAHMGTEGT